MISIKSGNEIITNSDLNDFEAYLGKELPKEYKDFMLKNNGGAPTPYRFITKDKFVKSCVVNIFPLSDSEELNLKNKYIQFNLGKLIPNELLPIAIDPTNAPICISLEGNDIGKIYYWHMEFEDDDAEPSYKYIHLIADGFNEFLNGLFD